MSLVSYLLMVVFIRKEMCYIGIQKYNRHIICAQLEVSVLIYSYFMCYVHSKSIY